MCPPWLAWILFPHSVNYHIEHHLYPAIPHYNLRRAHVLMQAQGILDGAEVRGVEERVAAEPEPEDEGHPDPGGEVEPDARRTRGLPAPDDDPRPPAERELP